MLFFDFVDYRSLCWEEFCLCVLFYVIFVFVLFYDISFFFLGVYVVRLFILGIVGEKI